MRWYWYIARPDELLIDCDAGPLMEIATKRWQRWKIKTRDFHTETSRSKNHYHVAIRLEKPMPEIHRMIWQLYFMDHTWRSINNLFRSVEKVPAAALLISDHRWKKFWRQADYVCNCKNKHAGPEFSGCPVAKIVRPYESRFNAMIGTNK